MVPDQQTEGCSLQKLTFTFSACELQLKVFQNTTSTHVAQWQVDNTVARWLTGIMIIWSSFWHWVTLELERPPSSIGIPTTSSTASSQPQWASTSEKNEWWVTQRLLTCKSKCYEIRSIMLLFRHTRGPVLMGWLSGTLGSISSFGTQQDKKGKTGPKLK